jgi:hypothetical protein
MGMNAGIVVLQDGSPCIVYDETLPGEVVEVELCEADHQLTLIYELPPPPESNDPFGATGRTGIQKISKIARKRGPKRERLKLDYPLDRPFYNLLKMKKVVAIGSVVNKNVKTIKIVSVVFTNA